MGGGVEMYRYSGAADHEVHMYNRGTEVYIHPYRGGVIGVVIAV